MQFAYQAGTLSSLLLKFCGCQELCLYGNLVKEGIFFFFFPIILFLLYYYLYYIAQAFFFVLTLKYFIGFALWVVPVHQPQASSIVHRIWTGDSFHI